MASSPRYRVGFVSLGCPKNQVDCEVMLGAASGAGFEITPRIEDADAVVINTCSFIQPAIDEAEREIRQALRYKKRGRVRAVVVSGCLPQYLKDEGRQRFPDVDAWLTPDMPRRIGDVLSGLLSGAGESGAARAEGVVMPDGSMAAAESGSAVEAYLNTYSDPRTLSTPPSLAYIKIADGCDHRCKFCIIPGLRGPYRSRTVADIKEEARGLLTRGVGELVLVSQDSSSYGKDIPGGAGLAELLEELCALDCDFWLRVMYLYPSKVTPQLAQRWAALGPKLLPYFDIPLQHASGKVLRAMGRGGNRQQHNELLAMIRAACPDAVIRTSLITGYPGEDEEAFGEMLEWVESGVIDRLGVFTYSELPRMTSAQLPGKVPPEVAEQRRAALMVAQERVRRRRDEALVGTTAQVLIDSVRRSGSGYIAQGRRWQDAYEVDYCVSMKLDSRLAEGKPVAARLSSVQDFGFTAVSPISET